MEPVFDTASLAARKRRAQKLADEGARFLMRRAAEDLSDRLGAVERRFSHAAALFSGTPAAAAAIAASGRAERVTRVEADAALLCGNGPDRDEFRSNRPEFINATDSKEIERDAGGKPLHTFPHPALVAPTETLPLPPESIDLAVSLYALHEMNDVPGMLIQIRRALRPDGLFLGCMAGAGTLAELREALLAAETELHGGASPRVFPFADVRDAGALLQRAGLALPVADVEAVTVRYDTMFSLMCDLRAMGATNALAARSRRPASRALFSRAAEIYAERFSDPDGRVRATFSTIWLSGWAPHASQQKPAKRGSASVSLAKILGGDAS